MPTKIEWADDVWNPIAGCTKCSPGCLNCYAERMAIRLNGIFAAKGNDDNWAKMSNILKWDYSKPELYEFGKAIGWNGEIELFSNRLDQPRHWKKPRRIFVCSMSDLFHPKVPLDFQIKVFDITQECLQHTFLILTKRPKNMMGFFGGTSGAGLNRKPLRNVHLGVSISNQAEADEKIPILLQIPAAVRWLSIEPMLEGIIIPKEYLGKEVDHAPYFPFGKARKKELTAEQFISGDYPDNFIDGVIVGGESGPGARLCPIKNIRDVVNQCKAANVPVFVKQIHLWDPMRKGKSNYLVKDINQFPEDLRIRQLPERSGNCQL